MLCRGAAVAATKIILLGFDPPEGREVNRNTVLGIDVEFHIRNFTPGGFRLMARFSTRSLGTTSPGARGDYPYLQSPSGKVHLCVPLAELYDSETVVWPLTMMVSVHEDLDAAGSSRVQADTSTVQLKSSDVPAEALARQAAAPPIEYHDALMKTFGYFEARAAMYKVCIRRFPETQPQFTPAYRRWEERHAADIAMVSELQFQEYKVVVRNNMQVAAKVFDSAARRALQVLRTIARRGTAPFM